VTETTQSRGALMHRIRRALPAAIAFVLLLAAWEAASRIFHIPDYLVPSPSAIAAVIVKTWTPIIDNSAVTLLEAAAGLALSIVISVPLGILIVSSPTIERVVYPFLVASQAVPKVALAPIFVVWFGFGLLPKVLIAFFIAFFPIVVNTVVGMSRTPADMIHLMRSLGASRTQILLRVRLMAAAPYIFAGVKIASAFAVVGAIVGEFIAADSGLGYMQLVADNNLQTPLLFGTLVALSVMGIGLFYLVALVEVLVLPRPLRQARVDEGGATP
jgi:NitT/TauT family transport system permease protein